MRDVFYQGHLFSLTIASQLIESHFNRPNSPPLFEDLRFRCNFFFPPGDAATSRMTTSGHCEAGHVSE